MSDPLPDTTTAVPDRPAASVPTALVAIGASAGGLDALERFFDRAPTESGAAFVVIQHLSPDHKSMMVSLLARHTAMPVVAVTDDMPLEPNRVHLIPPGQIMRVEANHLRLTPKIPRVLTLPIDEFFHSAAAAWGERTVGIILSGTGTDGTRGAGAINEAGGLLAAQEPTTARFDGMPASVIGTGMVDHIRSAEDLGTWVGQVLALDPVRRREGSEAGYDGDHEPVDEILRLLSDSSGINFVDYKPGTVRRRIERRMVVRQCADLMSYLNLIYADRGELLALRRELLISVTRFFRDTEAFAALAEPMEQMVRAAIERRSPIRIWSAGTSTGEEAYSLAIMAHEACDRLKMWPGIKVFATDVEQANIDVASIGSYPESIAAEVPADYLERYFLMRDGRVTVRPELRQCMVFARHNLLTDPPFTQIDMVVCRNFLIYLKPPAQERALRRLQYALRPKGYLFLGSSEMGSSIQTDFLPVRQHLKIWQQLADAPRRFLPDRKSAADFAFQGRDKFQRGTSPTVTAVEQGMAQLLRAYAPPPAILLNRRDEIVHSYGDVGQFLSLRPGAPSLEVTRLLPDALLAVAKAVLFSSTRGPGNAASTYVALPGAEGRPDRNIRLVVLPVGDHEGEPLRLLVFEELAERAAQDDITTVDLGAETRDRLEMLENELGATRESLRVTVEEMEASSEELQATNEEMMASNEELQSANEELQSVNEELNTVNAEYQEKIDILNRVNADLENLTRIVPTGTIFVDGAMNVTRFSPDATHIFRLRDGDIGRPIADLAHRLEYPDLIASLKQAMRDFQPVEREVAGPEGRQFIVRILPYRLPASDARAAVLSLVDVTQTRTLRMMQAVIDGLAENVAVLDSSGTIQLVNRAWTDFASDNGAQDSAQMGPGANYLEACPATDTDAATRGLREVLSGRRALFELEYPCDSPTRRRWFKLHARALPEEFSGAVVSHLDVTRWKYPEDQA